METYEEFINNILETRGRFGCGNEYHERHHIIPKCCGGNDDEENLIDLFAHEHFLAHKMLANESPDNKGLIYAWTMMSWAKKDNRDYELTPEEYEEAKKAISDMQRNRTISEEALKNMGMAQKRRYENISERQKASEIAKRREANPEFRKRKQETMKKRFEDPELRKLQSEKAKERFQNPEECKKISERAKQRYENPEYVKKMSNAMKGILAGAKNPTAKKVICLDTNVIYNAASLAEKSTGVKAHNILQCCNDKQKTAGGFRWRFVYDTTHRNGIVTPGALTLGLITEDQIPSLTQQND